MFHKWRSCAPSKKARSMEQKSVIARGRAALSLRAILEITVRLASSPHLEA